MKSCMIILLQCFICVTTVFSGIPAMIDDQMWVPNDVVNTMDVTADKIFLGGSFTYIGPCTGGGTLVDTVKGQLLPGFPKVDMV
jgi:hypothetical protein